MRTFSKAFGLAGLRIGFMVSNPETISYVSKSRSIVESNTLSMKIAEFFLDNPKLKEIHVKETKDGSAYIQNELDKRKIRWYGGNYTNGILIFLDSKAQSDQLVKYMNENKIYIRGAFESPFESTIRVSIGPKPVMIQFMEKLNDWMTLNSKSSTPPLSF